MSPTDKLAALLWGAASVGVIASWFQYVYVSSFGNKLINLGLTLIPTGLFAAAAFWVDSLS